MGRDARIRNARRIVNEGKKKGPRALAEAREDAHKILCRGSGCRTRTYLRVVP